MCGIIGILDKSRQTNHKDVEKMSLKIKHRGPDDDGIFSDTESGVFLAHRRLSLLDLSSAGHQPMESEDFVISYNGEIYNFKEIRHELEKKGIEFFSESDTEVLLKAWQEWGKEAIHKCRGMFAFIIYDKKKSRLFVYRDRLGVKPLYYYHDQKRFICSSELSALIAHPAVPKEIDTDSVTLFLQLGYIPAPYSIYKNIYKLEPAHSLVVDKDIQVEKEKYWSLSDFYNFTRTDKNEEAILDELEDKLSEACDLRMIADVPVGVFLSGGIDSSLVTALLVKKGYTNLSTFTIGFGEATHDESKYAKAVAEHLGTKHHEYICTTKEAQEIIPKLPEIYGEPFADASAIPTYLLSQFTKQSVTASLSADGGDELFGGYTRYQSSYNVMQKFSKFPPGLGWLITLAAQGAKLLARLKLIHPKYVHKFARVRLYYIYRHNLPANYAVQNSYFSDKEINSLLIQPSGVFTKMMYSAISLDGLSNHIRRLQHIDTHTYLPDDILVKVDRASMAVSLESREPLLDNQVWEYVARLSDEAMGYDITPKHLLKQILYRHIPQELVDRPKQGFGVPLDEWLRRDLRYLLDEYLNKESIEQAGLLNYEQVAKEKADFLSSKQPYNRVWNILMLQMWYKEYQK